MLTIDSYRRAEAVPGGPDRDAWIQINDGTRTTGARVMVHDSDLDFASEVADAIVTILPDATRTIAIAKHAQTNAEERSRKDHAARVAAESRLDAVLHGKRRLFGEALVRVDPRTGDAWLLDPVKQDRGWGLRFPSLAELWRAHPELRPVRWDNGDLIVDATIAIPESKDQP